MKNSCVSVNTRELKNIMKDHSEANRRWTLLPAAKREWAACGDVVPKNTREKWKMDKFEHTHISLFVFSSMLLHIYSSWVCSSLKLTEDVFKIFLHHHHMFSFFAFEKGLYLKRKQTFDHCEIASHPIQLFQQLARTCTPLLSPRFLYFDRLLKH